MYYDCIHKVYRYRFRVLSNAGPLSAHHHLRGTPAAQDLRIKTEATYSVWHTTQDKTLWLELGVCEPDWGLSLFLMGIQCFFLIMISRVVLPPHTDRGHQHLPRIL